MFDPAFPIERVRPADYNPRRIAPERLKLLIESINAIGMLKPIIVTTDDLIIAGHQRSKSLLAAGVKSCPAYVLPPVGQADEIAFNMSHNAADKEVSFWKVRCTPPLGEPWSQIPPDQIVVEERSKMGGKFAEVLRLMNQFGEWGNAVVTESGEVIVGQLYAAACKAIRRPLRIVTVPDAKKPLVLKYFSQDFGQFSYEHLKKTTWAQSLAQPMRLREHAPDGGRGSYVYKDLVFPILHRSMRILDFGAGQKDHVTHLAKRRYQAIGVEFFHRKPGSMDLDVDEIQHDIDVCCRELREHGLFDLVVCDTVINSVDSLQAEEDVMTTIGALARDGGTVVFSGRDRDGHLEMEEDTEIYTGKSKAVTFMDEHGFKARFIQGVWMYQKFHSTSEARKMSETYVGTVDRTHAAGRRWAIQATSRAGLRSQEQIEESLRREFNLPWPNDKSVGRGDDIMNAYRAAIEIERQKKVA